MPNLLLDDSLAAARNSDNYDAADIRASSRSLVKLYLQRNAYSSSLNRNKLKMQTLTYFVSINAKFPLSDGAIKEPET